MYANPQQGAIQPNPQIQQKFSSPMLAATATFSNLFAGQNVE
ncbi:hypothetical protein [Klebsiella pneumoniae IS53]|nr:hypothetical protein [Klebsiella pneumoniae IS53]